MDAVGLEVEGLTTLLRVAAEAGFFSGAFVVSLDGLFGCFTVNGDLSAFDVALADVEIGAVVFVAVLFGLAVFFTFAFGSGVLFMPLDVPFGALWTVGSAEVSLV